MLSALVLWLGFTLVRENGRLYCDIVRPYTECTVGRVIRRDPYCLVDPTCVSPFFNDTPRSDGSPYPWQGFSILNDPLLVTSDPIAMLALPNYGLFTLLYLLTLAAIVRVTQPGNWRRMLIVALLAWCILEVIRWLYSVRQLAYAMNDSLGLTSTVLSASLLLPILFGTVIVLTTSKRESNP